MKISFILYVILTYGHSVTFYRLRHKTSRYSDTCDYTDPKGKQYLCGDICVSVNDICDCGGQRISSYYEYKYCCAPASACTMTITGAECSSGEVLSWNSSVPCNETGRCFNDVLKSQHFRLDYAKYTCQDNLY